MGTRHLVCVVKDNEFKIAQYGQWDGYLSGQGTTVYNFLKTPGKLEALRKNVDSLTEISDEKLKQLWVECGAKPDSDFVSLDVSDRFGKKYPELSRDTCAGILDLVATGGAKLIRKDIDFAADSLFCEYAYVIDLDKNTLEIYRGFQKAPHKLGRFCDMPVQTGRGETYFPVALAKSYKLSRLPKTAENFVSRTEAACEKVYRRK